MQPDPVELPLHANDGTCETPATLKFPEHGRQWKGLIHPFVGKTAILERHRHSQKQRRNETMTKKQETSEYNHTRISVEEICAQEATQSTLIVLSGGTITSTFWIAGRSILRCLYGTVWVNGRRLERNPVCVNAPAQQPAAHVELSQPGETKTCSEQDTRDPLSNRGRGKRKQQTDAPTVSQVLDDACEQLLLRYAQCIEPIDRNNIAVVEIIPWILDVNEKYRESVQGMLSHMERELNGDLCLSTAVVVLSPEQHQQHMKFTKQNIVEGYRTQDETRMLQGKDTPKFKRMRLSSEWRECIDTCIHSVEQSKTTKFIFVYGDKSAGKSTFLKYAANTYLSHTRHCSPLAWVDLDIGQPELFLPGTISVHFLDRDDALLKPSYEQVRTPWWSSFVGQVNPASCQQHYQQCVFDVFRFVCSSLEAWSFPPQVCLVNTMGWVQGIGRELLQFSLDSLCMEIDKSQTRHQTIELIRLDTGSSSVVELAVPNINSPCQVSSYSIPSYSQTSEGPLNNSVGEAQMFVGLPRRESGYLSRKLAQQDLVECYVVAPIDEDENCTASSKETLAPSGGKRRNQDLTVAELSNVDLRKLRMWNYLVPPSIETGTRNGILHDQYDQINSTECCNPDWLTQQGLPRLQQVNLGLPRAHRVADPVPEIPPNPCGWLLGSVLGETRVFRVPLKDVIVSFGYSRVVQPPSDVDQSLSSMNGRLVALLKPPCQFDERDNNCMPCPPISGGIRFIHEAFPSSWNCLGMGLILQVCYNQIPTFPKTADNKLRLSRDTFAGVDEPLFVVYTPLTMSSLEDVVGICPCSLDLPEALTILHPSDSWTEKYNPGLRDDGCRRRKSAALAGTGLSNPFTTPQELIQAETGVRILYEDNTAPLDLVGSTAKQARTTLKRRRFQQV